MTELNEIAGADRTDMVAQAASNAAQPRTIERRLVHKSYDENVLVSHIEAGFGLLQHGENSSFLG